MQPICTHCGLIVAGGNLWCHRTECSVSYQSILLQKGEKLGDLEIVDPVGLMPSGILYRASRNGETILLKIGHLDPPDSGPSTVSYAEYIRREARLLLELHLQKVTHEAIPHLLPPRVGVNLDDDKVRPYGKIGFRGHILYYIVFAYVEGDMLSTFLAANPQPPQEQVAWFMLILCSLLNWLGKMSRDKDYHHTSLNPDVILVRTDSNGMIRPTLFDFGCYQQDRPDRDLEQWLNRFIPFAYIAPEWFSQRRSTGESADVYGLGVLAYEMLAGKQPYDYKTRTQALVKESIRLAQFDALERSDLPEEIAVTVNRSMSSAPEDRLPSVAAFAQVFTRAYGAVPEDVPVKPNPVAQFWRTQRQYILLILLIIVVLLIGIGIDKLVTGSI